METSKNNFKQALDTRSDNRLAIAHDIHQLTADTLTGYMLDYLYSKGLRAVTMGECMQDPEENWYRQG